MKTLMDPYDWLPDHGENQVFLQTGHLLDFVVTVVYDPPAGGPTELRRDIVFNSVAEITQRPFPVLAIDEGESTRIGLKGVEKRLFRRKPAWRLGTLGMDEGSERAVAWMRHFGGLRTVNRYFLHFLSANLELEVFAEGFALGEELLWEEPST